jgi:hypothetical protein
MTHLAAHAAADAAVLDMRDRILPQWIGIGLDRQRRAARQADAAMVAGAGVRIDAEPFAHDALAVLDRLGHQRLDAALAVELAFRLRDQHLGPLFGRHQRIADRIAHPCDVIGARHRPGPADADAAHRLFDRVVGLAVRRLGARGQDVLPARRRGITVVDDDRQIVVLVEDGIADAGGQAVMPEPAIAHDGNRTLVTRFERRRAGGAQPIAHRGVADVERRQDREQVAADVGRDVERAQFLLHQLHRREDRPFGATGAETGGPLRHHCGRQGRGGRRRHLSRGTIGGMGAQELGNPVADHRPAVFARARQHFLADDPRLQVGTANERVELMLDELGLPLLDHQHRALARAEVAHLIRNQRIGDVEDVDRQRRIAIGVR